MLWIARCAGGRSGIALHATSLRSSASRKSIPTVGHAVKRIARGIGRKAAFVRSAALARRLQKGSAATGHAPCRPMLAPRSPIFDVENPMEVGGASPSGPPRRHAPDRLRRQPFRCSAPCGRERCRLGRSLGGMPRASGRGAWRASKGNQAHGRSGWSRAGNGAGSQRTRRWSNALESRRPRGCPTARGQRPR